MPLSFYKFILQEHSPDQKKKRGTHTAPPRGTGIPKEEDRQAHAIQLYSMNIALRSLLLIKLASFRSETFSERYVIYMNCRMLSSTIIQS
ncbi:hypothetical protein D0T87_20660 [Bacteroides sp. 51]|nr:hypothetical protein [Bacteroides sp. 51]